MGNNPSPKSQPLTILSIDPGYDRCGWAIGVVQKNSYQVQDFDLIQTDKKQLLFERFNQIRRRLNELIAEYQPQHLAIENLYFAKNTTTALRVAEVRGLIIGLALTNGLEIFEYDPATIKVAVTGHGQADKTAVAKLTLAQLKLTHLKQNQPKIIDDAIDALAIGLTHAVSYR